MSAGGNSLYSSNFDGSTSDIDILSSISDAISLATNLNGGGTYYGRYFCLGDLLIQFTDYSSYSSVASSTQTSFYINYPHQYDTTPYYASMMPYKSENQNFGAVVNIINFNNVGINFNIHYYNCEVGFLVIGPRPASLS